MGIGAGVEDDAVGRLPRLLNPVDELALVIRLAKIEGEAEFDRAIQAASSMSDSVS